MSNTITLRQRLADSEKNLHDLINGNKPRVVQDVNGERVEYTRANRADLENYIAHLKAQLGLTPSNHAPLRPFA